VEVGLVLGRGVDVHDDGNVVDVDPASGDVGRYEHPCRPVGERREVALARALAEVAVELNRRDARGSQLLGEALSRVLRPHEEEAALLPGGELMDDPRLVACGHRKHVVGHRRDRSHGGIDGVGQRIVEIPLHEHVDSIVEGCGEEHPLPAARRAVEEALHAGKKAKVGHVVCLVEDGDLDARQVAVTLADEVLEATGACDKHVDAAREGSDLWGLANAAENDGRGEPGGPCKRLDDREHLVRQLARWDEHEPAWLARSARAAREAGDERDGERQRLAAPRAPTPKNVATRQGVDERSGLDGKCRVDALRSEHGGYERWDPKSGE